MHKRILLVEDDMYIALALKIRLQAEGYDVSVVHGTVEACRVARENPPDLALIDYNLPDGTGFEVMAQFSADERTASIDNIIMTASKKSDLRDQALAAGALEQAKAELLFGVRENFRHRRLRHVEAGRGIGHRSAGVNGIKNFDVP